MARRDLQEAVSEAKLIVLLSVRCLVGLNGDWSHVCRLEISEKEVSRQIDIWGADIGPVTTAVTREAVESELLDPEGPYMRLRG